MKCANDEFVFGANLRVHQLEERLAAEPMWQDSEFVFTTILAVQSNVVSDMRAIRVSA